MKMTPEYPAGLSSLPAKLPPLKRSRESQLPKGKDFHLYLCCHEEDLQLTASITKEISSKGYRCAEFFRDGAPNLPVFYQVESFVCRSVWIGLIFTDIFLKSCETKFQIEVFLQHVLQVEGKKCIILLITDKSIRKLIPSVLLPFTRVYTYKEKWLSQIDKILRELPSNDISDTCGNRGHVDKVSLWDCVTNTSQPHTFCGKVDKNILPLHKQRDARIHLKQRQISAENSTENWDTINDQQEEYKRFYGLAPFKRPSIESVAPAMPSRSTSAKSSASALSGASAMSGGSAISSDRQTYSELSEDILSDDEILYGN